MLYPLSLALLLAPLCGATVDAAILHGVVTHAESGRPLPGATVRLLDLGQIAETDALAAWCRERCRPPKRTGRPNTGN